MQGFPKHLNTKQDYLNCLAIAPDETRAALLEVFEARQTWQPVRQLTASENPKQTSTKKIVELPAENLTGQELPDGQEPVLERWLYEFKEDATAWFFRLGFTVEEAQAILADAE